MIIFDFEQKGCCGEHQVASVQLQEGLVAVVDKTQEVLILVVLDAGGKAMFQPKLFSEEQDVKNFIENNYKVL